MSCYDLPTRDKLPALKAFMGADGTGWALDIGIGTGYTTARVFEGQPTVCIDVHEPNLRAYQRQQRERAGGRSTLCVVARATALPFKRGAFRFVLCSEVLEHLEDDEAAAAELARVLAVDGRAVLSVPYTGLGFTGFLELLRVRTVHDVPGPEYHVRPGYDERTLETLLRRHDLSLERHTYYLRFVTKLLVDGVSLLHLVYQRLVHRRTAWTWADVAAVRGSLAFRFYAVVFPLLWAISRLDGLLGRCRGFGLIALVKPSRASGETGSRGSAARSEQLPPTP